MRTAVVVTGGPHGHELPHACPRAADLVVAVDSGLHLAHALGWTPELLIGDLDSVGADALERAVAEGTRVERYPADKDATDLELALDHVSGEGAEVVTVIGSPAGRFDHLVGGVLALASPRYASMRIDAWLGGAHVVVVHDARVIRASAGSYLTILPVNGPADGVRTTGLRWPLHGERLAPGTSRGTSNELLDDVAHVSVDAGTVLVVVPEEEST